MGPGTSPVTDAELNPCSPEPVQSEKDATADRGRVEQGCAVEHSVWKRSHPSSASTRAVGAPQRILCIEEIHHTLGWGQLVGEREVPPHNRCAGHGAVGSPQ